jgi:hypothetical protein
MVGGGFCASAPSDILLRGQVAPFYGIAIEQQLVNWVAGQAGRVVAVGIATGNREHALCD